MNAPANWQSLLRQLYRQACQEEIAEGYIGGPRNPPDWAEYEERHSLEGGRELLLYTKASLAGEQVLAAFTRNQPNVFAINTEELLGGYRWVHFLVDDADHGLLLLVYGRPCAPNGTDYGAGMAEDLL